MSRGAPRFIKVDPDQLWNDARFTDLSDLGKVLYMWVFTSPHQTGGGPVKAKSAYGQADLGWPPERFDAAMKELTDAGLIIGDPATGEFFVTDWFRHSPPMNASHRKGYLRILEGLRSTALRKAATEALDAVQPVSDSVPGGTNFLSDKGEKFLSRGR